MLIVRYTRFCFDNDRDNIFFLILNSTFKIVRCSHVHGKRLHSILFRKYLKKVNLFSSLIFLGSKLIKVTKPREYVNVFSMFCFDSFYTKQILYI